MMLSREEIEQCVCQYDERYRNNEQHLFSRVGPRISQRGHLTKRDLMEIVRWKAPRVINEIADNENRDIKAITRHALQIEGESMDMIKLHILTAMGGIGIPIASAILTVVCPEQYGIIDRRSWRTLYRFDEVGCVKTIFNLSDWLCYLGTIKELGLSFDLSPRDIDKALFMYDKLADV